VLADAAHVAGQLARVERGVVGDLAPVALEHPCHELVRALAHALYEDLDRVRRPYELTARHFSVLPGDGS
jgi:hypothetical protein